MKMYAVTRYEDNFEHDVAWFDGTDLERAEQHAINEATDYDEEFYLYAVEPVLVGRTKTTVTVIVEKTHGGSFTDHSW